MTSLGGGRSRQRWQRTPRKVSPSQPQWTYFGHRACGAIVHRLASTHRPSEVRSRSGAHGEQVGWAGRAMARPGRAPRPAVLRARASRRRGRVGDEGDWWRCSFGRSRSASRHCAALRSSRRGRARCGSSCGACRRPRAQRAALIAGLPDDVRLRLSRLAAGELVDLGGIVDSKGWPRSHPAGSAPAAGPLRGRRSVHKRDAVRRSRRSRTSWRRTLVAAPAATRNLHNA
jgi:hypothetical protein